ncbi:MAG: hypothetical protein LC753_07405 [Acidobacteria bacterium]|nr:hypothetical protein [Acidobacteriota bacterium]MCA1650103.1 hypothetical protein [Acidobacteriota bacterium]
MLTKAEELSIRRLHDAWIEAERRGDVEWVPPGGPSICGRDAGRDLLVTPAIRLLSIRITNFVLTGGGGRAIKACRYETVFELTERASADWRAALTPGSSSEGSMDRVASVSWLPDVQGPSTQELGSGT